MYLYTHIRIDTYEYIYTYINIHICHMYMRLLIYVYPYLKGVSGAAIGNTNKNKVSEAFPLNPRTLEVLSKKEARLLSRYVFVFINAYACMYIFVY